MGKRPRLSHEPHCRLSLLGSIDLFARLLSHHTHSRCAHQLTLLWHFHFWRRSALRARMPFSASPGHPRSVGLGIHSPPLKKTVMCTLASRMSFAMPLV